MKTDALPLIQEQKPIDWIKYFVLAKELQILHEKNEKIKAEIYGADALRRHQTPA